MKVFVDTNVILDYVLQREHYAEAKLAISSHVTSGDEMLMSVGGFYTMLFLIDKYFRLDCRKNRKEARELTRNVMRKVLKTFHVADHDDESLLCGLDDTRFTDIEDSCQIQLAKKHGCEQLLTFNASDFPSTYCAPVKVVSLM